MTTRCFLGLRLLLQRQPDFEIVAEAGDGVEGLKRARNSSPTWCCWT